MNANAGRQASEPNVPGGVQARACTQIARLSPNPAAPQLLLQANLPPLERIVPWGQMRPQALQQQQPDLHSQARPPLRLLQSIPASAMVLYERSLLTGVDHRHPVLSKQLVRWVIRDITNWIAVQSAAAPN